ncbi:MAG TPA: putative sugar nucleotidyl transferase [Gemmatimonadales bacterium]|nr:putative sugar nucleotidyl transferase [Gemmatimonadales bacterium]
MSTPLILVEPTDRRAWAPFAGARPVAELRAGVWRIRERWEAATGCTARAIMGDLAAGFQELDEPATLPSRSIAGPALVARSDFAPAGTPPQATAGIRRLVHDGVTVGWMVAEGETWSAPSDDGEAGSIDGLLLRGAFDLLTALERFLAEDCADFTAKPGDPLPDGSIVIGDPTLVCCYGAVVEPGVVFDTRAGAVVIEQGAEVRHGTRLEGPCFVGAGSKVLGGPIKASAFGPRCNVRGEIASSCFIGYANKGHDGFVGHSVLGHWVNLGAGTTTSNLKNTYGAVRLTSDGTTLDTGRQFLGTLFGDHAKTAIGTMLSTGTIVGAGANVFGAPPPKWVPPMAWGHQGELLTEDGFLRVAERVMPRRDVTMTPERRAALATLYRRFVP